MEDSPGLKYSRENSPGLDKSQEDSPGLKYLSGMKDSPHGKPEGSLALEENQRTHQD